ncbi:alpha/beta fold hydrolase [Micromonospora krabiensis]|uniref:Pimeloyl-ACP methyl ester carboxylesterase n=1 Tax=Micromonospora krabiensis TaxID=307121 RepID=A0A1C3MYT1_9ACTN|nr:alpha/beta fold hydrolase [Micromonospora krabiensis]SBV25497.1 Pimeloyl-ACP methyl ester carboxylesterase [Micromonospora krabiensis]
MSATSGRANPVAVNGSPGAAYTRDRPRHVTVAGRRVRHRIDGDGPPVVLLHGIGRTMRDFTEQHELLAQRFRVHSVDLPGYGGSLPMTEPYSLPALARFVAGYLDAVGVDQPAHLVGNSLGGAVAMQLAVTEPERVASLALVASAGFGQEVALALRLLSLRPLGRLMLRPRHRSALRVERALFHDPSFATADRVAYALEVARQPYAPRVLLETLRSLGGFRGARPEWREELLTQLAARDVPVLVVWGDRDLILPAAHLDAARERLPRARTHLFQDCGHMPQIERAAEFHRLLLDFWSSPTGTTLTATVDDPRGAGKRRPATEAG